jgi:hypothetical protein
MLPPAFTLVVVCGAVVDELEFVDGACPPLLLLLQAASTMLPTAATVSSPADRRV